MKKMNKNHGNVKSYEEIYKEYNSQFSEECIELLVYNEHMSYGFRIFEGAIEEHWSSFLACIDVASGRAIKDFAADEMAEDDGMIYTWEGDEGETAVSKEEFKRRLSDGSIYVEPSGDFCFSYELDEMFTDHSMSVKGNISGKMDSVSLEG